MGNRRGELRLALDDFLTRHPGATRQQIVDALVNQVPYGMATRATIRNRERQDRIARAKGKPEIAKRGGDLFYPGAREILVGMLNNAVASGALGMVGKGKSAVYYNAETTSLSDLAEAVFNIVDPDPPPKPQPARSDGPPLTRGSARQRRSLERMRQRSRG